MPLHLLDTGVILRAAFPADPHHARIQAYLSAQVKAGITYAFASQSGVEMWGVLTRPLANGGYGLTPSEAAQSLKAILSVFPRLPDTDAVFPKWLDLVTRYGVSGRQVHDTRLAAGALSSGITHLVTLNGSDFARFAPEGLILLDPLAQPPAPSAPAPANITKTGEGS